MVHYGLKDHHASDIHYRFSWQYHLGTREVFHISKSIQFSDQDGVLLTISWQTLQSIDNTCISSYIRHSSTWWNFVRRTNNKREEWCNPSVKLYVKSTSKFNIMHQSLPALTILHSICAYSPFFIILLSLVFGPKSHFCCKIFSLVAARNSFPLLYLIYYNLASVGLYSLNRILIVRSWTFCIASTWNHIAHEVLKLQIPYANDISFLKPSLHLLHWLSHQLELRSLSLLFHLKYP